MADIEKIELNSENLVDDRLAKLRELMPECFSESGIDFEKLRLELGDEVDEGQERYAFTWPGKMDAIRQSQTTSTATLRPCVEKSRGRDGRDGSFDSDNIYIEGDNLEVLKLLQRGYAGKVKMIYIDPPYNTGHDFVYKDKFGDTIANYKEQTGQADHSNAETNGRYHSDWCSMMYPRLRLARELLREDGVIFISIDGNELSNLTALCNEVFGEQNAIPMFNRVTKKSSNSGDNFSPCMDYVLGYARNLDMLPEFTVPLTDDIKARYRFTDEYLSERGPYQEVGLFQAALKHGGSSYPIECPDGELVVPPNGQPWRWNEASYLQGVDEGRIVFKRSDRTGLLDASTGGRAHWNVYTKVYLKEREGKGIHPKNYSDEMQNTLATNELKKLGIVFDFAKPTVLIRFLMNLCLSKGDTVIDFFSGSGTTAHAALANSTVDDLGISFILVQLPENAAGLEGGQFADICQLAEERIRRAGDKIKAEVAEANAQPKLGEEPKKLPDIGFRVFTLDESGIQKPEPGQLLPDVVKPERSDLDIVFEMMLKWGLELTLPVEREEFAGYPAYSVAAGELICCLAPGLTLEALDAIADECPRRVFILDSILSDSLKLNALQIFRTAGERHGEEIELRTV